MKTSKQLREERQQAFVQMEDIMNGAEEKEGVKQLTTEQRTSYDKWDSDFTRLSGEITNQETFEKRKAEITAELGANPGANDPKPTPEIKPEENKKQVEEKRSAAFNSYFKKGLAGITDKERSILIEHRAQTVGVNSEGGFTVPEGHFKTIEVALADYVSVLNVARVIRTNSGNQSIYPTMDDTGNTGKLLAESGDAQAGANDLVFGQVVFNAFKYSSDLIKTSNEWLQDDESGGQQVLADALATRLGRILNTHSTIGTGSSQPRGAVVAAATGVTSGAAGVIDRDDILSLIHAVDPAYRRSPSARLMFNDTTLAAIRQLAFGSGDARPLYQVSPIVGEPDRIEGQMFEINQDMANIATTAIAMIYGDFSKYIVRISRDVAIRRLDERFAELDSVGWVAFMRFDADLIAANAIKKLTQA